MLNLTCKVGQKVTNNLVTRAYSALEQLVVPVYYSNKSNCWKLFDKVPRPEPINTTNWPSIQGTLHQEGRAPTITDIFVAKNGNGFVPADKLY